MSDPAPAYKLSDDLRTLAEWFRISLSNVCEMTPEGAQTFLRCLVMATAECERLEQALLAERAAHAARKRMDHEADHALAVAVATGKVLFHPSCFAGDSGPGDAA